MSAKAVWTPWRLRRNQRSSRMICYHDFGMIPSSVARRNQANTVGLSRSTRPPVSGEEVGRRARTIRLATLG
jgi:hypothetical protein